MKLFKCQHCGQLLYFENWRCERCGRRLGFLPDSLALAALDEAGDHWLALAEPGRRWRFCANARHEACNWLVPAESGETFCRACRHNGTVPDLAQPDNVVLWQKLEIAKRRLFYTLLRLRLPIETRAERPKDGLVFEFLADSAAPAAPPVMTGHTSGRIVIALAEADDAIREQRRAAMGEPLRTLLGHFRHEIGHWYWERLLAGDAARLAACRAAFGDDSADYGASLATYYKNGPPADWRDRFVSPYATAHPWEDFAETWAHYLHIVDTLEMARAFGVSVSPRLDDSGLLAADVDFSPYRAGDVAVLIDAWLPLTFALNSLNRCVGQPDIYPFVISPAVIEKLRFVYDLAYAWR